MPDALPHRHDTSPNKPDTSPRRHDTSPRRPDTSPHRHDALPHRSDTLPNMPDASPRMPETSPSRSGGVPSVRVPSTKYQHLLSDFLSIFFIFYFLSELTIKNKSFYSYQSTLTVARNSIFSPVLRNSMSIVGLCSFSSVISHSPILCGLHCHSF